MSTITLNLGPGATSRQQASGADNDSGGSVADRVAAIMKQIDKLQKDAAALQGPPEEVAKMRKAIEQESRALELKMQEILRQQARDQQEAQSSAAPAGDTARQRAKPASGRWPAGQGTIIDEIV